jgi:hypothetical protein
MKIVVKAFYFLVVIILTSCSEKKVEYFENGNVHFIERYNSNGQLNGKVKYFHENGKAAFECKYQAGKRIGHAKWFYENGNVKLIEPYESGLINGMVETFSESGYLTGQSLFKFGEKIETFKIDSLGNRIKTFARVHKDSIPTFDNFVFNAIPNSDSISINDTLLLNIESDGIVPYQIVPTATNGQLIYDWIGFQHKYIPRSKGETYLIVTLILNDSTKVFIGNKKIKVY